MIHILNDFLPNDLFIQLQEYTNQDFKKVTIGEKDFSILPIPKEVFSHLEIKGYEMTAGFIREAHNQFDFDNRIHSDGIILNKTTHLARVLYLNEKDEVSENGTCFWQHKTHGHFLPLDTPKEEFDRMILEDSEDLSKWTKTDIVVSQPNKLLTYSANLFHSKFPAKIEKGVRKVLVAFYTKKI